MSNNEKLYRDALDNLTDHYLETLESMSPNELQIEHEELVGNSLNRVTKLKGLVGKRILERKKAIFCEEENSSRSSAESLLSKIKNTYGTYQEYLKSKMGSGATGFEDMTFAFRNRNDSSIAEAELEGILEDLIELGKITEKDL